MYRCSVTSSGKLLHNNAQTRSLFTKLKNGQFPLKTQYCRNSTTSSGGGSGLYIGATAVTLGGFIGGASTYAGYDNEFRKSVEDAVPFTKTIFDAIHGEIKENTLLPIVEKDLSIPFEPEVTEEHQAITPLFYDEIREKTSNDVIALNTLDTPTVSMIDLDISQIKNMDENHQKDLLSIDSDNDSSLISQSEGLTHLHDQSNQVETDVVGDALQEIAENTKEEDIGMATTEEEEMAVIQPIVDENPLSEEEIETLASIVDKEALEVLLSTSSENIEFLSSRAIEMQKEAANSLRHYMKAFASFMPLSKEDADYETKVKELAEIEHQAQEKIDTAKEGELSLTAEIDSLGKLVSTVRERGDSPIADKAEESVQVRKESLSCGLNELDCAQQDFNFLLEYQTFTSEAPSSLQYELKSFARDLLDLLEKKEFDISRMPRDQAILALALKRKELFDRDVLKAKEINVKEVEELLEKQKTEVQELAEETMAIELKRLENEKNLEKELKIKSLEENYEREMLSQLKRQTSAHNEHLAEELDDQAKTLNEMHSLVLGSKLDEQHKIYYRELEKKVKSISAIQAKITDVVNVESRQRNSQELWIAAQTLNGTLNIGTLNGRTRTLMPEMISILQLSERNATVNEIVESFPEQAALFGVIPEKDLINRFRHVKQACKKVAAVGEGDSLAMYFLSYIKSIFVFSRWYLTDVDAPVDVEELTSYEILAKAEHFIQQGDLDTAAKLMSQLKGVARKLCGDWLNEVRLLLETKQTAILLQAYAASLTAGLE